MTAFADLVAKADRAAQSALGGEVVTYASSLTTPGSFIAVVGIFDAQFVLAKGSAHAGVEASVPAVFFRLSDLPIDPELDDPRLTIGGSVYRVIERMYDGMGGVVLTLRRAS